MNTKVGFSKKVFGSHKEEIRQLLEQLGAFNRPAMIERFRNWQFGSFLGIYAMGLYYELFKNFDFSKDEVNINDVDTLLNSHNGALYASSIANQLINEINQSWDEKNTPKIFGDLLLLKQFSELKPVEIAKLGEAIIFVFMVNFMTEDEKKQIIEAAYSSDFSKSMAEQYKKIQIVLSDESIPDILKEKLLTIKKNLLVDENGRADKNKFEETFHKRHAALKKSVNSVPSDILLSNFVTKEWGAVEKLDEFVSFIANFFGDEDSIWGKLPASTRARFDDDYSDILSESIIASKENRNSILASLGELSEEMPEFSFDSWENLNETLEGQIVQNLSIEQRLSTCVNLSMIGATSENYAKKASQTFYTSLGALKEHLDSKHTDIFDTMVKRLMKVMNVIK